MSELVFLTDGKNPEPYTTSDIIAEMTGNSYRSIQRIIETQKERLETFGVMRFEITLPSKGSKGGRPKKVYHLNEQQATLLITFLKNTDLVADFKTELVRQFYEMRDYIQQLNSPVWQDTRSLGKEIRRRETDAIKRLVNYATERGSTGAVHYYKALSSLTDKAAGIESRDRATIEQLTALYMMEKLIEREISQGIQTETPYKLIYSACKERLESFLSVVR